MVEKRAVCKKSLEVCGEFPEFVECVCVPV